MHDIDNHGVITRGELLLTMNGTSTSVKAGAWYHVPANEEHSAKFEVETDEIEFWFYETLNKANNSVINCATLNTASQHSVPAPSLYAVGHRH